MVMMMKKMKVVNGFVMVVMGLSVVFSLSLVLRDHHLMDFGPLFKLGILILTFKKENEVHEGVEVPKDKLLGNLLPTGFDENSCLSRYQSLLYRRGLPYKPSPYLISKLRSYEAKHKKCAPYTDLYNKTVEDLKSSRYPSTPDCKYVVWIAFSGMGNRILTLASAFLYALLTDRILLVDRGHGIPDLFCEPFPGASWLLPLEFPLTNDFNSFNQKSNQNFGNMLKINSTASEAQPYIYIHLVHDYDDHDKLFFCDQDHAHLHKIPWLIMKSDNYFIPALFLMSSFEQELHTLFPYKEIIFHLLGRYLFHPTNSVWGLITRDYEAYLSKADVRTGIQIRVFDIHPGPFKHILDQILSCTLRENILPQISQQECPVNPCFHAPLFYDCKLGRGADTGAIVPHVRHCEDMSWGLKLVQHHSEL